MSKYLDDELIYNLREVINKTNIFIADSVEKEKFNLICAVMDRFDNSVVFLNNSQSLPLSENDIILFFHHCCIIRDGINTVSKILKITNINTNIFQKYCLDAPFNMSKSEYKGDEKFFEYLRSLFFAHPFITDRSIPKAIKGEIQYSPYILNDGFRLFPELKDSIGVTVYSNKRDMFHICIKYDDIKNYIRQKYMEINNIISSFQQIIDNKVKEWSKRKVNRNQSTSEILLDIIDIYKERYLDEYDIKKLYDYLTYDISNKENKILVDKYRNVINSTIPSICDCVDQMDYDTLYELISPILYPRIKKVYPMLHYQLEKIYCYLDGDNDKNSFSVKWGLKQAEEFSNNFAKKWVKINVNKMDFTEIKLLTTIACYFESKEEVLHNYD